MNKFFKRFIISAITVIIIGAIVSNIYTEYNMVHDPRYYAKQYNNIPYWYETWHFYFLLFIIVDFTYYLLLSVIQSILHFNKYYENSDEPKPKFKIYHIWRGPHLHSNGKNGFGDGSFPVIGFLFRDNNHGYRGGRHFHSRGSGGGGYGSGGSHFRSRGRGGGGRGSGGGAGRR